MAGSILLFICACLLLLTEGKLAATDVGPATRKGRFTPEGRPERPLARTTGQEGASTGPMLARRELRAHLRAAATTNYTLHVDARSTARGAENGAVAGGVHPEDAKALLGAAVQWRKDINTVDEHKLLASWDVKRPCSHWYGVTCDSATHRVTAIRLPKIGSKESTVAGLQEYDQFSLSGPFPVELGSLPELRTLILAQNALGGDRAFPKGWAHHAKLSHLDVSGTFGLGSNSNPVAPDPEELCKFSALTYLNLANTGLLYLPKQFSSLKRLAWLDLSMNLLSGRDVPVVGSLTGLTSLSLHLFLRPSDLVSLSRLTGLRQLDLSSNFLGSFPTFLRGLPHLEDLRLSSIVDLDAVGPDFALKLPSWLGSLKALTNLDVSYNSMGGAVPSQLGALSRLARLSLRGNQFTARVPKGLLDSGTLTHLDLSHNSLDLTALAFGTHAASSLKHLDLSANGFKGAIPRGLSSLTSLKSLSLWGNHLTGAVPPFLWAIPTLTSLDLSKNRLTGLGFSGRHSDLGKLKGLHLSRNRLQEPIPEGWSALTGLTALSLSYNNLTGTLPSWLVAVRGLVALDLRSNRFTGSIPAGLGSFSGLMGLSLSRNQLTGSLPDSLFRPGRVLRVANNLLSGSLPPSALSLVARRVLAAAKEGTYARGLLDVSGNYLTGPCYSSLLASLECPLESSYCDYSVGQELQGLAQNCLLECSKIPQGTPPEQRSNAQCLRFCGADKRNGPCNGHGSCSLKVPKNSPTCTCGAGFVATASEPATCVPAPKEKKAQ